MEKGSKRLIAIIVLVAALGVAAGIYVELSLGARPERQLARSFLLSNEETAVEFGGPLSVSFTREGESVSYYVDRIEGKYRFKVEGSKKTGAVRVRWRSDRIGGGFAVTQVDLLRGGEKPKVLWRKAPE